jgi:hypothetical protein
MKHWQLSALIISEYAVYRTAAYISSECKEFYSEAINGNTDIHFHVDEIVK